MPGISSMATGALAAGILLAAAGCKPSSSNAPPAGQPLLRPAEAKAREEPVQRERVDQPFVNSLGMRFIPLPDSRVAMCIWETREQDFVAYLKSSGQPVPAMAPGQLNHPVSGVSWNDATAFCHWLTEKERAAGRLGPQDRYRLPKDKEWTTANGGKRYPWGDDWPKTAERDRLPGYKPASGAHTAPVGSYPPNALGFHDLGGNVFEWCQDWYYSEMNPGELRAEFERLTFDGGGAKFKVLRGASWVFFDSLNLLSNYRYFNEPQARNILYGFRCVLEVDALGQGQPPPKNLPPWKPPVSDERAIAGRETYRSSCVECHQYYDPVLYPDADWDRVIQKMRGKAKLQDRPYQDLSYFVAQIRKNQ